MERQVIARSVCRVNEALRSLPHGDSVTFYGGQEFQFSLMWTLNSLRAQGYKFTMQGKRDSGRVGNPLVSSTVTRR